jgi:hypothetical protein
MKKNVFLSYNATSSSWSIKSVLYEIFTCDDIGDCYKKTCEIEQGIILSKNTNWTELKGIDDAEDKHCVIEKK